jgi:acyl carrier protein
VRLAAYLVPAGREGVRPAELREHLRATLPEYMVPAAFVPLDALPLTTHGKLDRRALPAPQFRAEGEDEGALPETEAEGSIALIWREILGVERVARHDDFFELGGDSLLATRVVVRTRDLLRRQVPLTALFDHRTLAAFSGAAAAALPAAEEDDDDLLAAVGEGEPRAAGEGWAP